MCLVRSQGQNGSKEEWDLREEVFVQNTRRALIDVVSEKLEMPPLFEVRDDRDTLWE